MCQMVKITVETMTWVYEVIRLVEFVPASFLRIVC